MLEDLQIRLSLSDFKDESKETIRNYLCPHCQYVLFNPVVDECGHLYCEECLKNIKICTLDPSHTYQQPVKMTYVLQVNKLINERIAYCKYKSKHCYWEGPYMEIVEHIKNACRKHLVNCSNKECSEKIAREDKDMHEEVCRFRMEKCEFCSKLIAFQTIKFHGSICPERHVLCEQGCGELIRRREVESHLLECSMTPVPCTYAFLGCDKKFPKAELAKHAEGDMGSHMEQIRLFCLELFENPSNIGLLGRKRVAEVDSEKADIVRNLQVEKPLPFKDCELVKQAESNISKEKVASGRLVNISDENKIMINLMESSKELEKVGNSLKCKDSGSKMLAGFAFLSLGDVERKWTVKITNINCWIGIGICNIDTIIYNRGKENFLKSRLNHDCYLLDSEGYIYENTKERERFTYSSFQNLQEYSLCYKPAGNILSICLKGSLFPIVFKNIYLPKNGRIVPCVIFLNGSGEVAFDN